MPLQKLSGVAIFAPLQECEWNVDFPAYKPLSRNAETKDFARLTSHPVRGWTGKNKAFCSPGTQNAWHVIKVYNLTQGT